MYRNLNFIFINKNTIKIASYITINIIIETKKYIFFCFYKKIFITYYINNIYRYKIYIKLKSKLLKDLQTLFYYYYLAY